MSHNAMMQCNAVADPPNMTYIWQKDGENVYHVEWVDVFQFSTMYHSLLPSDNHWHLNVNISNTALFATLDSITSLFPQCMDWGQLMKTWTGAKVEFESKQRLHWRRVFMLMWLLRCTSITNASLSSAYLNNLLSTKRKKWFAKKKHAVCECFLDVFFSIAFFSLIAFPSTSQKCSYI